MIKVSVVNGKQIQNMLRNVGSDINKELDDITKDLANDVKKEAKNKVPVDKGNLKRSIESKKKGKGEYEVGSDLPYAAAIEYGTKRRTIRAKTKKVLAAKGGSTKFKVNSRGYTVFGREVQHPGTRAQPFMDPAVKIVSKGAGKEVKIKIQKIINKRIKKTK